MQWYDEDISPSPTIPAPVYCSPTCSQNPPGASASCVTYPPFVETNTASRGGPPAAAIAARAAPTDLSARCAR